MSRKQPESDPDSTAGLHPPEAENGYALESTLPEPPLCNELLHSILRNASEVIYHLDRNGHIVFVNEAVRRYGYEPSQVAGSSIMDFVHPDDLELAQYRLNERRTGNRATKALEIRLFPLAGTVASEGQGSPPAGTPVFSVNAEGLYKSGKINADLFLGTQGVARDISEYKDYESRLRLQAMVLDQIQDFVTLTDLEGNITYVNEAEARLFNRSREELLGRHVSVYGEDPSKGATQREILESTIRKGQWRGEVVNTLPDGSNRVMDCRTRSVLDKTGNPVALCGISTDITERKYIEDALRENNANLAAILENTNDLIASRDREGRLVAFNSAFARIVKKLFGIEACPGLRTMDYLPPEQKAHWERIVQRVLSGESLCEEFKWDFGGDDVRHYDISFNPIVKDGEIIGFVEFNRDITEQKKAQAALCESAKRFQMVADYTYDWEYWVAPDGSMLYVSPSCERISGYTAAEFIQRPSLLAEIMHPEDRELVSRHHEKVAGSDLDSETEPAGLHEIEYRIIRRDGHIRWIAHACRRIFSDDGKDLGLRASNRDITQRKLSEQALGESEERYRRIVETSIEGIWSMDADHRSTYVNSHMAEMLGYKAEDILGRPVEDFMFPEDIAGHEARMGKRHAGESAVYERRFRRSDGSTLWTIVSGTPLKDKNGRFAGSFGMFTDITGRKQAEAALAEDALRRRILIEQSRDGIVLLDEEGKVVESNRGFARMLGYSEQETLQLHLWDWDARWEREKLIEMIRRVDEKGDFFETIHRRKDGTVFNVEISSTGAIIGGHKLVFCVCRDITGRKLQEQSLQKSQERLESIFRVSPTGIGLVKDRVLQAVNERLCEMTGYRPDELIGSSARIVYPTDEDFEYVGREKYRQISEKGTGTVETRWLRKDGAIIDVLLSSTPLNQSDLSAGVTFTALDITERKQAAEAMRRANEMLDLAAQASLAGAWHWDIPTGNLDWTPALFELFGLDPSRHKASFETWRSILHPEDRQAAEERIERALKERTLLVSDYRILLPDGRVRWINALGRGFYDDAGNTLNMSGLCLDITERKQAERALHESEEKFRQIVERSHEIFYRQDLNTARMDYISPKVKEILGYSPEEWMIMGLEEQFSMFHPEDLPGLLNFRNELIEADAKGEKSVEREFRIKNKQGEYRWIHGNYNLVLDKDDNPALVVGSLEDITERKQAEQALRDSEERLVESNQQMSGILEYTHMLAAYLDTDFNFIWVNRAYAESGGHDPSFFPGRNHFDLYPSEENRAIFQKVLDIGKPYFMSAKPFVYDNQPGRGVTYWDWSLVPVKSAAGKVTGLILTLADVTGIKKAEEELRRSEWRLLEAQRVGHIGNWELDIRTGILWWSEEVYRIFGFEQGGFGGTMEAFFNCVHPDDKQMMEDVAMAAWNDRGPFNVDHRIVLPDGSARTVQERAEMVFDESGEPVGMIGTVQDITERKTAEEKIRRTNELLSSIREAQAEYISDSDHKAVFARLLQAMVSLTGSQFGFLDEVLMAPNGEVYKKSLAISDISWDEQSRELYRELEAGNLEFHHMLNLSGLPALDGKLLISNDPAGDMRRGGLPEGHPPLHSFMGIPMLFGGEIVGVMGLANRPGGFSEEDAAFLEPFTAACSGLIHSLREQREKQAQQEEILRAEQALRESDARIRSAAESSLDAFMILRSVRDEQGRITDFEFVEVNGRTEQLVRMSRDQLVGHRLCEVLPINRTAGFFDKYRKVAESGIPLEEEFFLPETNVPAAWFHHQVVKVGDGVAISNRDITRRKRSEQALYSLVLETTGPTGREFFRHAVWWLSRWLGAEITMISERGEDGVQRSLAMQVDGQPVSGYEFPLAGTPCEKVSHDGFCCYQTGVAELFPDDHDLVKFNVKGYAGIPMRNGDGETLGVICVLSRGELMLPPWAEPLMNMLASRAAAELERLRAEEDLHDSEERLGFVLSGSGMGWWEWDYKTGKVKRSQGWADLLGYTFEEAQKPSLWAEILHPEDKPQIDQEVDDHLAGKIDKIERECRARSKSGEYLWVVARGRVMERDSAGEPMRLSGTIHNVTERKRLEVEHLDMEKQLQQSQKLESLGVLAGGIAHDFNNILGIISGYAELAESDAMADPASVAESLQQVRKAAERAKGLTNQILAFSRQSELERIPLKFSLLVKEAIKMLRASIPTTIEIVKSIGNETGMVIADPNQLHQVLMNLATNAAHAMREQGGTLTFNLSEQELDAVVSAGLSLPPARYIKLSVGDTGHGIDPAIIGRIFDPFFTTKPKGQGTGMSLSVVHGIVRGHGGAITVASEPGRGTVFDVYLPLVQPVAEKTKDAVSQVAGGKERILLVDDEVSLVSLGRKHLAKLGYTLTAMTSSLEALAAFEADPRAFDLVITDQTMPVLTGARLAEKLLKIRPGLPVILCTGFSDNLTPEALSKIGIRELVLKPFRWDEMTALIRKVLDTGKQNGIII